MLIRTHIAFLYSLLTASLIATTIGCTTTGVANLPAPAGLGESQVQFRGQDDDDEGGLLGNWGPESIYRKAKTAAGYGPDEGIAKRMFEEGDTKFKEATELKGEARTDAFLAAAESFKQAAAKWPKSTNEEDSLFMLGESYFFANHYPKSAEAFDKLLTKYENTRYVKTVGTRRFAMADYWIKHQKVDPDWGLTPNLTSSAMVSECSTESVCKTRPGNWPMMQRCEQPLHRLRPTNSCEPTNCSKTCDGRFLPANTNSWRICLA